MRRLASAPVVVWLLVLATGCVDRGPTDGGRPVVLDVVPQFQIDPDLFDYDPIDLIRLTARDASTGLVVAQASIPVSPTAPSWTVTLPIDLDGASSLVVFVDLELLSEGVVQWSGVQGPIIVRPGSTSSPQTVAIYRGPLDNQDVTAVTIEDAGSTLEMVAGTSTSLIAQVTLAEGSTASPVVYWTSSDETVATVSAEGTTVTLTAVAPGTAEIVASSGAAYDEIALEVVAPSPFDVTWLGTTPDWHAGANWSAGQVPLGTESVHVPVTGNDPLITQPTAVGDLTVDQGATVMIIDATLTVSGDLDAQGQVAGGGLIAMTGASATVRGSIEGTLSITGTVLAAGPLDASYIEVTGTDGFFDVNGQQVTAQIFETSSLGRFRMASAAGSLDVAGLVFLDGGDTSGQLTAGVLSVGGDFSVGSPYTTAFAPSGTHLVVFDGAADQTVQLGIPGATEHRFANVRFDQPGLVSVISALWVTGVLTVADGAVEASDYTVHVGGGLVDPDGRLSYAELRLIGDVAFVPSSLAGPVYVDATVGWPSGATIQGDLVVNQTLDVGTTTLAVTGNVLSAGTLRVPTGGAVQVTGTLTLGQGSLFQVDGTVTAASCVDNGATISGSGTQPCGGGPAPGTYTWSSTTTSPAWDDPANWIPAGVPGAADDVVVGGVTVYPTLAGDRAVASITVTGTGGVNLNGFTLSVSGDVDVALANGIFNGELAVTGPGALLQGAFGSLRLDADRSLSAQTLVTVDLTLNASLDTNGQTLSTGGSLLVTGAGGRLLMTDPAAAVIVVGDAYFNGGDHDGALTEGVLQVYGNFEATDASPTSFVSSGNHQVTFSGSEQTVRFQVPGSAQQRLNDVVLTSLYGTVFETDVAVSGDLDVLAGMMTVPAGATVSVQGAMGLNGGTILYVDGTVSVAGQCLTAGAVAIFGGGTQPCGETSPADRLWLGGAPGNELDWATAENWTPAGVPSPTETALVASRPYPPSLLADQTVGGLIVTPGGQIDQGTYSLAIALDVANDGLIYNGVTQLINVSQATFGLRGQFADLRIAGQSTRFLTGLLNVGGSLMLEVGLVVGEQVANVNGDFSTTTPLGSLIMSASPAGELIVVGNTTFDGGSSTGFLTQGSIYVGGDFTVGETHVDDAFNSTGTQVVLFGSVDQTLKLTQPGPGTQAFSDLSVIGFGGVKVMESDIYVTRMLSATSATLRRGSGVQELFVQGTDALLSLYQVEFDGLPLTLQTTSRDATTHVLEGISFVNMGDDETQLTLEVPGSPTGAPLQINAPVFDAPVAVGYFLEARNAPGVNDPLLVRLNGPTPASAIAGEDYLAVGNVQITWGP